MKKVLMAYIPVPHAGYLGWFRRHTDADTLFVLGLDILACFEHLRKDIRALPPGLVAQAIVSWDIFNDVEVLTPGRLERLACDEDVHIVLAADEVTKEVARKHLTSSTVTFESVFLRWNMDSARDKKPVGHDLVISRNDLDREMMGIARDEAEKSSDWWRRVGAVLSSGSGEVLITAHNTHMPSEQTPYMVGDPRSLFKRGVHIELSTSSHAEAEVIAEAAKRGLSTEGTILYVTTFPCPACAKLVACSGIKSLYFSDGYSLLDGESVLRQFGVEIFFVEE